MHMYVHNHVCAYLYMYICILMYTYICVNACICHLWCVCVYVCVYMWMYVFMFGIYMCMYIYVYAYTYMYIYLCVRMYVSIYIHTKNFLLDLLLCTVPISWLFILLCLTIIQSVDAEQQEDMFILNWHKRNFCPSVRTHLYICLYILFELGLPATLQ